jgi:hypothetical protein
MSDCVASVGLPPAPKTILWKPGMPYRDGATPYEHLSENELFAPFRQEPHTIGLNLDYKKLELIIRGKNYQIIDDKTNFPDCDCIMLCSSDTNILEKLKSIDTYIKIRITKVHILKHSNGNVYIKSIYMELPDNLSFINSGPYSAIYNKKHQKLMNESVEHMIGKTIHIAPTIPNFTLDATLGGLIKECNKNTFYPLDEINKGIFVHLIR